MKILVKKFSLCHDGTTYGAGSVADLPDDVAANLIQQSPKEFAAVDAPALMKHQRRRQRRPLPRITAACRRWMRKNCGKNEPPRRADSR